MSIMDSASETLSSAHPCQACSYRAGDFCMWIHLLHQAVPFHALAYPIDWAEPQHCAACTVEMEG